MEIANIPSIAEGEHLGSALAGIALANGFGSIKGMCGSSAARGTPLTFASLFGTAVEGRDLPELWRKMTAYPALMLAMTPDVALRAIDEGLRSPDSLILSPGIALRGKKIKLCSKCVEESLETLGRPVAYACHQTPCVDVCWKHGTMLSEFSLKDLVRIRHPFDPPVPSTDQLEIFVRFGRYVRDLMALDPGFCAGTVSRALWSHAISMCHSKEEARKAIYGFVEDTKEMFPWLAARIPFSADFLGQQGDPFGLGTCNYGEILSFLYAASDGDAEATVRMLDAASPAEDREKFEKLAASCGYRILTAYREDVVAVATDDGKEFITNPAAFMRGMDTFKGGHLEQKKEAS